MLCSIALGVTALLVVAGTALGHRGQGNATPSNAGNADPKVSHPMWSQDYCTKSPDNPNGRDFRHACVHHDGCLTGFPDKYGNATYWSSRKQCNDWFGEDLRATCRELYPGNANADDLSSCLRASNIYHFAVMVGATYKGPSNFIGSVGEPGVTPPKTIEPIAPLPPKDFPVYKPLPPVDSGASGGGTSAPKPSSTNLRVVVYGGGHVGVAFDVGWQAGRDPVTCHFFRDGAEVFTAQCGTSSSKQFFGVPVGTHSWHSTVSDQFGVYSDPTNTVTVYSS